MPTSERWQIPHICDVLAAERPRSVLDVCCGWGKYGVMAREYAGAERVDCIDIAPPRYHVYDREWVGDVRQIDRIVPSDARWEMAVWIEAIEHLDKTDAYRLLDWLLTRSQRVLVSTPWGFRRQEIAGMPYETHRSGWFPWDFLRYRIRRWSVHPGVYSKHLRRPRLWQFLVLVERGMPAGQIECDVKEFLTR